MGTVLVVEASAPSAGVATGDGQVWFAGGAARDLTFGSASATYNTLVRLDPNHGGRVGEVALDGYVVADPVIADGHLWVVAGRADEGTAGADDEAWIYGIESRSGAVTRRIRLPVQPGAVAAVAVDDGVMWVASVAAGDGEPGTVMRIDLEAGRAGSWAAVGAEPGGLVVAGGSVWVVDQGDATVVQLDGRSLAPGRVIRTGGRPHALAASGDALWIGDPVDGTVKRIALP